MPTLSIFRIYFDENHLDPAVSYEEDCLYLNVYTPENGVNKSVMVWLHGGALTYGKYFKNILAYFL